MLIRPGPWRNWSRGTYPINMQRPVSHFIGNIAAITDCSGSVDSDSLLPANHEITPLALIRSSLVTLIFLKSSSSTDLSPSAPLALLDKVSVVGYV